MTLQRLVHLYFIIHLLTIVCAKSGGEMNFPGLRKKIMLLGSSITQRSFSLEHGGWGAALQNWYSRTADVLNRGAGGYNSRWLRTYLPRLVGPERPDMVILFIGNNDSIQEGESQHVPLEEYRGNIVAILEQLSQIKKNMIVLVVSTTQSNDAIRPRHSCKSRERYSQILQEIISQKNANQNLPRYLEYVDVFSPLSPFLILPDDLHDGAHLNKQGNKKLFEAVKHCINTHFPSFSPDFVQHKGNRKRGPSLVTPPEQPPLPPAPLSGGSKALEEDADEQGLPSLQLTVPLWHHLV